MEPGIEHLVFHLFGFISAVCLFSFGFWEIRLVARSLFISEIKSFFLYLWHTLFTIAHYYWVTNATGDIVGTYINSLDPEFTSIYPATIFVTKFYSILSVSFRFSFFTTFLVVNILGTNVIMIIEYFYKNIQNRFHMF